MSQIKSRQRVKEKGEVFTRKQEIKAMLNQIPDICKKTKFLEPSCGNGNFLIEILKYKLRTTNKDDLSLLMCLCTTYAVDIMTDNVLEAKLRLHRYIKKLGYSERVLESSALILTNNIQCADFLKDKIMFCDYIFNDDLTFNTIWSEV